MTDGNGHSEASQTPIVAMPQGSWRDYVAIARLDHVTKQIFILPGIILALALRDVPLTYVPLTIFLGFLSAVGIASANYVINEWLDRDFDSVHPTKSGRSAVQKSLSPYIVYAEYLVLVMIGLGIASRLGTLYFATSLLFALSGLIYNVRPLRTKDRTYLDVISESFNNPIRLTLGWCMIDPETLPPVSLLFAFWMGGAFLMAAKRLSEYRDIAAAGQIDMLHRYRRSFISYTAESLTVSCLIYAMLSAYGIGIFLIKFRQEYIIALPFVAALFTKYFWLALRHNSIAQRPERTFRSRRLIAVLSIVIVLLLVFAFVDVPYLDVLYSPALIHVDD